MTFYLMWRELSFTLPILFSFRIFFFFFFFFIFSFFPFVMCRTIPLQCNDFCVPGHLASGFLLFLFHRISRTFCSCACKSNEERRRKKKQFEGSLNIVNRLHQPIYSMSVLCGIHKVTQTYETKMPNNEGKEK